MLLRPAVHLTQSRCVTTYSPDTLDTHFLPAADSGKWSVKSIAWLMVQIWFGNTYLSFAQAESFHPVFGPIMMITYACLSNTLLLTGAFNDMQRVIPGSLMHIITSSCIRMSYPFWLNCISLTQWQILSHTFSTINDDALAEVGSIVYIVTIHQLKALKAMFRRAVSTIEG